MALAYERTGSGEPLVLLHGVTHRRQAWAPLVDRLAPHRDLIMVDLPGHGESPTLDPSAGTALDQTIDQLGRLCAALGVSRPHVAGNSLGGRLALELAVRGQVRSATVLSPAGFWRANWDFSYTKAVFGTMRGIGRVIEPAVPKLTRSALGRGLMYAAIVAHPGRLDPDQALHDYEAFKIAWPAYKAIVKEGTPFAGQIPEDIPVTIAWGTRDSLLLPYQAKRARRALPAARHIPLPGCGHVPMSDDPAQVASVLLQGSASTQAAGI
ncbi:alpha/beta fold hydrolase [Kutzneria viridogrisea]|uniref:Pimeloyl-ACP methyl ester carboxylesterase n=1 Tax=Kutzneria viridogrisea TaxID=47990 RepID=A0ABR6BRC4_9PSEU|nr:pimeloyl-ACP methyl ester carboxylesterase [Kutzneria viridogrisea]